MLRPRTKPFDLDWLGKLKQIESLSLSYSEMKNYDALASLPDLRQLGLGRTTINDPAFLAKLSNLRMLNLRGLRNITDFSSLAQLTNLQNLDISATQLSDIKLLEGLTKLQYLNLNSTKIKDIAPLKNLISLQELHLQDCENISDRQIEDLQKNLPELKILRCSRS